MNIFLRIKWLLGFNIVRCRVCKKWCEPSIALGDICSFECYNYEKKDEVIKC